MNRRRREREVVASRFDSPREFFEALLAAGVPPSEAERRLGEALDAFRTQVRRSHPSAFSSMEAFVNAMVMARLPTPEIEARVVAAREWVRRTQEAVDAEERRLAAVQRQLDEEEDRVDLATAAMLRRLGLEDPEDAALAEMLERPEPPLAPDLDEIRFGPWKA